ncbi:MAG: S8 family serine peptidase [Candidatus Poseidoniaceae archaeon]|nr:S8 family serine peptidase [Candidatus Poseidoniaceae archaeon]
MSRLDSVELLPEPDDDRILSAIDPSVVGFQDEWRSEVTGWAPMMAKPIHRVRGRRFLFTNLALFAILASLMLWVWQSGYMFIDIPPPKSEWAIEQAGFNDDVLDGLTGKGVRVCIVDTGIDISHSAFEGFQVVFNDMISNSASPVDYGVIAHGTLMAGILISQSHQMGVSSGITLGVVAALDDDGTGMNTAGEQTISDAIEWCIEQFSADIISLSLGGTQSDSMTREGPSVSSTRKALDRGIFVVAAAGNDGGNGDDGRVSVPSNVPLAISVGASSQGGDLWDNSSKGNQVTFDGEQRVHPNQKPEIIAPGVGIISTGTEDSWFSSSGTSDSTVFVTGALALILEDQPQLRSSATQDSSCIGEVKQSLRLSASDSIYQHDDSLGYGNLDAGAWLEEVRKMPNC